MHPDAVWEKILTSPDSSSLAVLHRGQRIGFCHLITSVAEQFNASSPTNAPEGLVRSIKGYKLDMSGSISTQDQSRRVRFDGQMSLAEDQTWEELRLQIIARPLIIDVQSRREEGLIHIKAEGADYSIRRSLRLDQLHQPETVLAEFAGPSGSYLLNLGYFHMPEPGSPIYQQELHWKASTDRIKIGRSISQIYRLELRAMEGYQVVMLVSRAGEILRVELPGNLTLINEALTGL